MVTDFVSQTVDPSDTDRYYVACENVEDTLICEGIPPEKVLKTGIPIRDAFYARDNRSAIINKYNLDPHKKILIIFAGTYRFLRISKKSVTASNNLQTIVICGKNQSLQREQAGKPDQYKNLWFYSGYSWILFPSVIWWSPNPGGITLSEVVTKKIPVILYNPTPGQEGENAQWFKQQGAAVVANNFNETYSCYWCAQRMKLNDSP